MWRISCNMWTPAGVDASRQEVVSSRQILHTYLTQAFAAGESSGCANYTWKIARRLHHSARTRSIRLFNLLFYAEAFHHLNEELFPCARRQRVSEHGFHLTRKNIFETNKKNIQFTTRFIFISVTCIFLWSEKSSIYFINPWEFRVVIKKYERNRAAGGSQWS